MRISDWSSDVCSSDLQGDPLDPSVQVGAQASEDQLHKILGYIDIGKAEGAQCLVGGAKALPGGALDQGYFVQPTVFVGQNHMRSDERGVGYEWVSRCRSRGSPCH